MHQNFDLAIDLISGVCRGRVLASPAGEAQEDLIGLSHFVAEHDTGILLDPGSDIDERERLTRLENAGSALFAAVFAGAIGQAFSRSLDWARGHDDGVRIRIRVDAEVNLFEIPWEILRSPENGQFIALSDVTPICRYTDLPRRVLPLRSHLPLRALAVVSAPSTLDWIDVDAEWRQIDRALENLTERNLCSLERLQHADIDELDRVVTKHDFHVLHLACHGEIDYASGESSLIFEGVDGAGIPVSATDISLITGSMRSLRLVMLNSCLGAVLTERKPVAGIAGEIVRSGAPAVIAMQSKIGDNAAVVFAQTFYSSVASGDTVDIAVARARRRVFMTVSKTQWIIPALFLRAVDDRLFDLPEDVPRTDVAQVKATGSNLRSGSIDKLSDAPDDYVSRFRKWLSLAGKNIAILTVGAFILSLLALRPILNSFSASPLREEMQLAVAGFSFGVTSPVELLMFSIVAMIVGFSHKTFGVRAGVGLTFGFASGMSVSLLTVTFLHTNFLATLVSWSVGLLGVCLVIAVGGWVARIARRRRRQKKRI